MSARAVRGIALLAVAALAIAYLVGGGTSGGEGNAGPPPLSLSRWETLGCYELRLGSWRTTPLPTGAGADTAGRGEGTRRPSPLRDVPGAFEPPARLMLLPDSVDLWGRALPTRRAVPAPGSAAGPEARHLRWMVRADTLWILWSEGRARVGVALMPAEAGVLEGSARALLSGDSVDASAGATAWRVSCADGRRMEAPPRLRR